MGSNFIVLMEIETFNFSVVVSLLFSVVLLIVANNDCIACVGQNMNCTCHEACIPIDPTQFHYRIYAI